MCWENLTTGPLTARETWGDVGAGIADSYPRNLLNPDASRWFKWGSDSAIHPINKLEEKTVL